MPTELEPSASRARRLPKFRRTDARPPLQLTPRDIAIIRAVAAHRFLRSNHITTLIDADHKTICHRLTLLFRAGYLDRPSAQLEYYRAGGGSSKMVYALANLGAQVLIEADGLEAARVDWARKNHEAKRRFLLHTLACADLRVAITAAVRTRPGITLQDTRDLIAGMPATTQAAANPLAWRVTVAHNGNQHDIGVVPDHAFALLYQDGTRRCYLAEVDLASMPVERASMRQTSILKKCLAYEKARAQKLHEKQSAWRNFRVLIVTNCDQRAHNIRAAIQRAPALKSSPLFLVTDQQSLAGQDILAFPWPTSDGTTQTLI